MNYVTTEISIPTGTIKSAYQSTQITPAGSVFQFLLVRLKEGFGRSLTIKVTPFQFLLVRLKGNGVSGGSPYSYISIPTGTIKRPAGQPPSP